MQAPVSVPKKSAKPRQPSGIVRSEALKAFEERYKDVRAKLVNAQDPDNTNVDNVRKLSRFLSLYAELKADKATDESERQATIVLRKAFQLVKDAEKDPDFKGQKLGVEKQRFTAKKQGAFVLNAMKYLMKVYDRIDEAEAGEDGKYSNSVFSVPSAEMSTPPPPEPVPEETQTQEQTQATLAGQGAGARPTVRFVPVATDASAQAKTDGAPDGGEATTDYADDEKGEPDGDYAQSPIVYTPEARSATRRPESPAFDEEHYGRSRSPAYDPDAGIRNVMGESTSDTTTATNLNTSEGDVPIGANADAEQEGGEKRMREDEPNVRTGTARTGATDVDTTRITQMVDASLQETSQAALQRYRQYVASVPSQMQNEAEQQANDMAKRLADIMREGEERRQAGENTDNVNQNMAEEVNQVVQEYALNIPNAVERAAFIASVEQSEREDVREEARKAQVPAEAARQEEEKRVQEAAEMREQASAPPAIPAPVDVDIDIASLGLGDAGSVPSSQQIGDAMTQDKAKESMERKHRESLSVQQLKQEIEALHSVYDSLIPEFKKPEHQRQKASAMASGREQDLRQHLANMMASVRRYYTQGGMRVGVIISRDAFMSMQGQGGMSVPATSQQKGIEITKHGTSKFRPQVKNEQVMRGGINTKKTLDNYIPKQDPQSRRPQRPHAQLNRFDHPHPSVQLPRRTQPYDLVLKTKKR